CGKTTAGRAILRLIEPDAGTVRFDGVNLLQLRKHELRRKRRDMQLIFQDPYASLNPRMTIRSIVGEPFAIHRLAGGLEREHRVADLLNIVGLDPAMMNRYPHEFSGGQRQRIGVSYYVVRYRLRLIRLADAVSTHAVPLRWNAARPKNHRCGRSNPAGRSPVIWFDV